MSAELTPVSNLSVAMTGATGAIGSALYEAIAHRECQPIVIGRHGHVHWDLRTPMPDTARRVLDKVDIVIHCAGDVRLGASPALLYRVNTEAVKELVGTLATSTSPPRLIHMSSSFAAANREGCVHYNAYEESKWAADEIVRSSDLSTTIVRPSLVIGTRKNGAIARFSGVYVLLRLLGLGLLPAIPGNRETVVDIVPVDMVATSTLKVIRGSFRGKHIIEVTAGQNAPTLGWLFDTACEVLEEEVAGSFSRPTFVTPDVYHRLFRPFVMTEASPAQRVLIKTLEVFFPYFQRSDVFTSTLVTSKEVQQAWRCSVRYWARRNTLRASIGTKVWAPRQTQRQ